MQQYEKVKVIIESAQDDFNKFYNKGNAAAGTRVRKAMQDLKSAANEIRKEVSEIKAKA